MTAESLVSRRSPLDRELPVGSESTVVVRAVDGRELIELKIATGQDGSIAGVNGLASVLGLDLPVAGRMAAVGGRFAVWLGPGWWLIDVPADESSGPGKLESGLVQGLREVGGRVSAVEVSAGFCVLELAGPHATDVLAHGCSIDLHPRAFGPGNAARTMLAKAQVVLAQTDSAATRAPTYRIWVRTSFARYLVSWLLDAATEYVG